MEFMPNEIEFCVTSSRESSGNLYSKVIFLHEDHKSRIAFTLELENVLCREIY